MKVKNYMEDVVDRILPKVLLQKPEFCNCSRCISDIKALALNMLPPKYVATSTGEIYTKVNELSIQFETDAVKALVLAMQRVEEFPMHCEK